MAKGDAGRYQGAVNEQKARTTEFQNRANQTIINSNNLGYDLANSANVRAFQDYDRLMGAYQGFANGEGAGAGGGGGIGMDPYYQGFLNRGLEGYEDFSKTGGFKDQDIQDIRARAIAPTRAVYANAQDNIRRQRALQGGYSPNYTAATAKMARNLSSDISDANVNANASIAQMIQQGKLAGLGGMYQGADMGLGYAMRAAEANSAAASASRGQNLAALNAQQNLYEATPGLARLYGGMSLEHENNLLRAAGQNNQLGGMLIDAQLNKSKVPSNYQQALGNIGGTLGLAGNIAGGVGNLFF